MRNKRWIWFWLVLTVALLTAITIPNFVKHKEPSKNQCVPNLKQIDGAIQQWALVNKKEATDVPDLAGAASYLKGGVLPVCPQGGSYRTGATVMDPPICSLATTRGHSLP